MSSGCYQITADDQSLLAWLGSLIVHGHFWLSYWRWTYLWAKRNQTFPTTGKPSNQALFEIFKAIEVEEFMDWRVSSWDMPDSVVCMIRSENMDDGTVKEYIYQRESDFVRRLTKLKDENNQRITVLYSWWDCIDDSYVVWQVKTLRWFHPCSLLNFLPLSKKVGAL